MNTDIRIDTREFKGARVVGIGMESEITDHPVDISTGGYYFLSDNMQKKPRIFKVELTIYEGAGQQKATTEKVKGSNETSTIYTSRQDDRAFLNELWNNKRDFKFVSDLGSLSHVVIREMSIRENSDSANTFEVNLELKEIVVTTLIPVGFQYVIDPNTGDVWSGAQLSGNGVDVTLEAPSKSKSKDKTWLESTWDSRPGWVVKK